MKNEDNYMKQPYTLANGDEIALSSEYLALLRTAMDFGRKEFDPQTIDASYIRDALISLLAELDEAPKEQIARGLALTVALLELKLSHSKMMQQQADCQLWQSGKYPLQ